MRFQTPISRLTMSCLPACENLSVKIAVCLPALNEAETIGSICEAVSQNLMQPLKPAYLEEVADMPSPFVSDLVVIDGGSKDDTVAVAQKAGARVISAAQKPGKGAALYESVSAVSAEIIVWCDADLKNFQPECVAALAAPLLKDSSCMMVKGFYESRSLNGNETGGGRTSWLMARPLISLLFPELSHIREPLAGEYAIRKTAAERVPFITGYGVELGLLVDISRKFGVSSIKEASLGKRTHRNRPLEELSVQSAEILHTALLKAGIEFQPEWSNILHLRDNKSAEIAIEELPPIISS